MNGLSWLDQVRLSAGGEGFGALGLKVRYTPRAAAVTGTFADGAPAVLTNRFGKGGALCVATCPGVSYAKDAHFVPAELKERWPEAQRRLINSVARRSGAPQLVELSHPVVEAGVFESDKGVALILANFTYEPIARLEIGLPVKRAPKTVRSVENGPLKFQTERAGRVAAEQGFERVVRCAVPLELNDIVLFE